VGYQNLTQYNTWSFSNIEFDNVTIEKLNKRLEKYKEIYPIKDYVQPSRKKVKPLENGTKAPNFSGVFYPNDDSVHLSDYAGKVVLIDFWYKSCYPCIKAIPHISAIQDKYADKGLVVLGLNPQDNNEEQREQFPDFIEINKLDYPIVFIERDVPKMYHVTGYPTFYVIDNEGNIAYSNKGYGENTETILDSVLISLY
jgi:thiol-disulfide isomerase/thioredoxin